MTMLIHSTSLEEGSLIIGNLVKIFGIQKRPKDMNAVIEFFGSIEIDEIEDEPTQSEIIDSRYLISEELLIHEDARKNSPFYIYFNHVKNNILKKTEYYSQKNIFYNESFLNYFFEFLIPYYPLWSAIILIRFGLTRDSNASVENVWKIEKCIIMKNKLRVLATRYIMRKEKLLSSRIKERLFSLKSAKVQKNRKKKRKY